MNNKQKGFTLIEILLSLGILALGLSGILTLFPVGLDAGQKAIQDTTSTLIAESLMDVLRASILQKHPDGTLPFIFDGFRNHINIPNATYTSSYTKPSDKPEGISLTEEERKLYEAGGYQFIEGSNLSGTCGTNLPNYDEVTDESSLRQYGYDVYIVNNTSQTHLYDVTIVIKRNDIPIRRFYSQIMIPTK